MPHLTGVVDPTPWPRRDFRRRRGSGRTALDHRPRLALYLDGRHVVTAPVDSTAGGTLMAFADAGRTGDVSVHPRVLPGSRISMYGRIVGDDSMGLGED